MDKIFSFKEACEKNISKIKDVNWPEGQYIELNFIGTTPYPRCKYHVGTNIYGLPVSGIDENIKSFTFIGGVNSYEEYFDEHMYPELTKRINEISKKKRK